MYVLSFTGYLPTAFSCHLSLPSINYNLTINFHNVTGHFITLRHLLIIAHFIDVSNIYILYRTSTGSITFNRYQQRKVYLKCESLLFWYNNFHVTSKAKVCIPKAFSVANRLEFSVMLVAKLQIAKFKSLIKIPPHEVLRCLTRNVCLYLLCKTVLCKYNYLTVK